MTVIGVVVLVSLAIGAICHLLALRSPRVRYLRRMRVLLLVFSGESRLQYVRSLVPLGLVMLWIGSAGAVALIVAERVFYAPGLEGLRPVILLSFPLGLAALAILTVVVRHTGRPQWAIPGVFQNMSEGDLEQWFGTAP